MKMKCIWYVQTVNTQNNYNSFMVFDSKEKAIAFIKDHVNNSNRYKENCPFIEGELSCGWKLYDKEKQCDIEVFIFKAIVF